MADDLNTTQKLIVDITRSTERLGTTLKDTLGRDSIYTLGEFHTALKEIREEADKWIDKQVSTGPGFILKKLGLDRETAAVVGQDIKLKGEEFGKQFMSGFEGMLDSQLPGTLTRFLGRFAPFAGLVNQISAVRAEGAKMAQEMEVAFGRTLPESLNKAMDSAEELDARYEKLAGTFGKTRAEIDNARQIMVKEGLARGENFEDLSTNTEVLTEKMAALSKVYNVPMDKLVTQQITMQNELNESIDTTLRLYSGISQEIGKTDLTTYKLISTTMTLASAFKYQGANVEDLGGYLANVSEKMKGMEAPYKVLDSAVGLAEKMGAFGATPGMSMLSSSRYFAQFRGPGGRAPTKQEEATLRSNAFVSGMRNAREETDFMKVLDYLEKNQGGLATSQIGADLKGVPQWLKANWEELQSQHPGGQAGAALAMKQRTGMNTLELEEAIRTNFEVLPKRLTEGGGKGKTQEELFAELISQASEIAGKQYSIWETIQKEYLKPMLKDLDYLQVFSVLSGGYALGKTVVTAGRAILGKRAAAEVLKRGATEGGKQVFRGIGVPLGTEVVESGTSSFIKQLFTKGAGGLITAITSTAESIDTGFEKPSFGKWYSFEEDPYLVSAKKEGLNPILKMKLESDQKITEETAKIIRGIYADAKKTGQLSRSESESKYGVAGYSEAMKFYQSGYFAESNDQWIMEIKQSPYVIQVKEESNYNNTLGKNGTTH